MRRWDNGRWSSISQLLDEGHTVSDCRVDSSPPTLSSLLITLLDIQCPSRKLCPFYTEATETSPMNQLPPHFPKAITLHHSTYCTTILLQLSCYSANKDICGDDHIITFALQFSWAADIWQRDHPHHPRTFCPWPYYNLCQWRRCCSIDFHVL
jgi:hypothetical protein